MSVKTCFPSAHPYFCIWLIFTLSTAYLGVLNYVIYVEVVPFELNSMLKIVRRISLIYMLYVYIFSSIFVLLFLRTNYICRDLILYITLPISYITSVQYHHHAFSGVVFLLLLLFKWEPAIARRKQMLFVLVQETTKPQNLDQFTFKENCLHNSDCQSNQVF